MQKEIGFNASRENIDPESLSYAYLKGIDLRMIEWLSLDEILQLRQDPEQEKKLLEGTETIYKLGGDGSLGIICDLLLRHQMHEEILVQELGGGRALTAVRAHARKMRVLEGNVFKIEHRPIKVESELDQEFWTYLAGGAQLTVAITREVEQLMEKRPGLAIEKGYQLAGLASLRDVISDRRVINPEYIEYQEAESQGWQRLEGLRAVGLGTGLPIIGTFGLSGEPDQLWLLEMGAGNRYELAVKYGLVLGVGTFFPHGPDLLVSTGLIKRHEVSAIRIFPDQEASPNFCLDGELRTLKKEVLVTRADQSVELVIPVELGARFS